MVGTNTTCPPYRATGLSVPGRDRDRDRDRALLRVFLRYR